MAKRKKPTDEGEAANRSRQRAAARQGAQLRKTKNERDVYKVTSEVRGTIINGLIDRQEDESHDRKNNPKYREIKKTVKGKDGKQFTRIYYVDRDEPAKLDDVFHSTHEDLGLNKAPKGAPLGHPQTKATDPLSEHLRRPSGVSGVVSGRSLGRKSDPELVRETVLIQAAQLDRQWKDKIPDPSTRHQIVAEHAISLVSDQYQGANFSKVTPESIARDIDSPKVSELSDLESGLAYPEKRESKIAKSLKDREQGVRDSFREHQVKARKSGEPTKRVGLHGETSGLSSDVSGLGRPIHQNGSTVGPLVTNKKTLKTGQNVPKGKMSNAKFLNSLSPDERQWVDQQFEYGGAFYGAKGNQVPGAYRRWSRYSNARQAGFPAPIGKEGKTDNKHPTHQWLMADTRGRKPAAATNPNRQYKAKTDTMVQERYTGGVSRKSGTKASDRYKSAAPSHEESGIGIRVPGIPTSRQLKDENPDASDREIFDMRESAKQSVDEMLENSRMAHETRQANILGRDKSETATGKEDRVVFFTTSTGYPAVSVGANSLLGQYIVKKRKKMVYDSRMAPRAQLKGEFPYAVRDQHLVEVATGLSLGAQGRYGAFRHIGYRVGDKGSKGYGKMLPVGSQILRDSSGQPLYDRNGNLRYTEGYTRPFDLRPSNEVGLRVYLG